MSGRDRRISLIQSQVKDDLFILNKEKLFLSLILFRQCSYIFGTVRRLDSTFNFFLLILKMISKLFLMIFYFVYRRSRRDWNGWIFEQPIRYG